LVKKRNAITWIWEIKEDVRKEIDVNDVRTRTSKKSTFPKRLHLYCCNKIPDQSLVDIRQYFEGFTALKSLHFAFRHCLRVTPTGIFHLNEGLKRFSSLKKLDFYFENGDSYMNDRSLGTLTQGFRRHISLKRLRLIFWDCNLVTELGILILCKGLQNLVFLHSLETSFNSCEKITDKGLSRIRKLLNKLKNLQQLNFHFRSCPGVSFSGIKQITQGSKLLHFRRKMTLKFLKDSCEIVLASASSELIFQKEFWMQTMKDDFDVLENFLNKFSALESLNFELDSLKLMRAD